MNHRKWPYPGASWYKFDFHTHTPASLDTPWHTKKLELSPEQWLQKYMAAEIDCVVVTDHNTGAWIDPLIRAYASMKQKIDEGESVPGFRALTIFPGVEISVNGGIHLLAVLDTTCTSEAISELLAKVNYSGTKGDSDGETSCSLTETLCRVLESGAIPILAHADQPKGLLRVNPGTRECAVSANSVRQALSVEGLLAVEWVDHSNPWPQAVERESKRFAKVVGSDCHSFQTAITPGNIYTWVKMGSPSLEGLRLALLDGNDISIRRSDDPVQDFSPNTTPEHFIECVEIFNARFMGRDSSERLEFSPWFNALVGGRGTGKSTMVHFLRLAYRRENELKKLGDIESVARTFERFNHTPKSRDDHGGLNSGDNTKVQVVLMRDGERYRLNWTQNANEPHVEQEVAGSWEPSSSQSITPERFPLRLFSQGQIAALSTEGSHALLDLIDQNVGTNQEKTEIQDEERRFLALRANIRDLEGKLVGREALSVQLADTRRKLDRFEQAKHAQVLKDYQLRARQEREIALQMEAAAEFKEHIDRLANDLQLEDLPADLFDANSPQDSTAIDLLNRLRNLVGQSAASIRTAGQVLSDAIKIERDALPSTSWHDEFQKAKKAYNELIESLESQGVTDPSDYGRLVEERQRLESELNKLDALEQQKQQLATQSENSLEKLAMARRALGDKRATFLQEALADNPFVRISLEPYGRDPRAVERSFRQVLGVEDERFRDDILIVNTIGHTSGAVATLSKNLPAEYEAARDESEMRLSELKGKIKHCCNGLDSVDFGARFGSYLERQYKDRPEFFDRILTWYPEDSLKVEYSPRGDGNAFRPIDQASAGQRAAAMLAFLLADGNEPIVLDQPEDDLDNHLIYDLVVKQIRSGKQRRQIIVITHNPNIVVNGDAEMIHTLDFRKGQCRVIQHGCLQDKAIRDEVCRVMEGGREAFERRWKRLGSERQG